MSTTLVIQTQGRPTDTYYFFPVYDGFVQFTVTAQREARIALTTGPILSYPMYEIILGNKMNTESSLHRDRQSLARAQAYTPCILSGTQERNFWIKCDFGHIEVGQVGQMHPFLVYTDPTPFYVQHFGINTGMGVPGFWKIPEQAQPSLPPIVSPGIPAVQWVAATRGEIPPGAFVAGQDHDSVLYIGQAYHNNDLLPGKVHPKHKSCYVPWGGKEHAKGEYKVLCGFGVEWVSRSGSNIPPGAVPGGFTKSGETLYIGRAPHKGTLTVGKVQPSHGTCYIPYGGSEIGIRNYEILVYK